MKDEDVVALLGPTPEERLSRLTATLDAMEEGLQVIGADWRYLYVNQAVCRHGRKAREELLGHTMQELYPGIEQTPMFAVLRQVMEARTPRTLLNEFTWEDGDAGWFELRVEPHPDGLVVFSLDVTAQRRLELEAERAQRFDALARLAGGVAHDFNSLLSTILTCTGLALEELPPESPLRDELRDAVAAAESAGALIRQLLGFSRSRRAPLETVALDGVVREARPLLDQLTGRPAALHFALPEGPLVVRANRGLLEQVLVNLVVNARDAAHGEGDVWVSVRCEDGPAHTRAELRVGDTGETAELRPRKRAAAPFVSGRTPGHGTGLGLSTVSAIVTRLGGSLTVETQPNHGATFVVSLPLLPAEPRRA